MSRARDQLNCKWWNYNALVRKRQSSGACCLLLRLTLCLKMPFYKVTSWYTPLQCLSSHLETNVVFIICSLFAKDAMELQLDDRPSIFSCMLQHHLCESYATTVMQLSSVATLLTFSRKSSRYAPLTHKNLDENQTLFNCTVC